ncbi:ankyrin repeat domain-containing protein [Leptospira weilii]|uniref:ankyrin repeat domain-containing protein n=1 Tax=Leptospira weilii TaxID=28184 RepID=UPI0020234F7A|nr:ankyrin repeat domain-containing protein [Leptospira weilii]MCL8267681.1 ankyrin repeat domain-containing protein [Leptospira weilii]
MKKRFGFLKKWILLIVLCSIGFSTFLFSKEISKDKNQLLFDAVASENLTEIKGLLDLGADPNSILSPCKLYDNLGRSVFGVDHRSTCSLWDLVFQRNLHKTLALLIERGLKEPERSWAILNVSVSWNRVEITEILLQNGFKDDNGYSLELAASNCNLPILKLLLKSGLDPNASKHEADMTGSSLGGAVRKDCSSAAVELIQAGADVNKLLARSSRILPIEWAIERGARDVYFVLKKAKAEFNPEAGLEIAKKEYKEIEEQIKLWEDPYEGPEKDRNTYNSIKERELKHLNPRLVKYSDIIKDLELILEDRK